MAPCLTVPFQQLCTYSLFFSSCLCCLSPQLSAVHPQLAAVFLFLLAAQRQALPKPGYSQKSLSLRVSTPELVSCRYHSSRSVHFRMHKQGYLYQGKQIFYRSCNSSLFL